VLQGNRDEAFSDRPKAAEQAALLYGAGEAKLGTDEDAFVEILSKVGHRQAFYIFQEYKRIAGRTIEQALKAEMSGDLLTGLLAVGEIFSIFIIYDSFWFSILHLHIL